MFSASTINVTFEPTTSKPSAFATALWNIGTSPVDWKNSWFCRKEIWGSMLFQSDCSWLISESKTRKVSMGEAFRGRQLSCGYRVCSQEAQFGCTKLISKSFPFPNSSRLKPGLLSCTLAANIGPPRNFTTQDRSSNRRTGKCHE